MKIEVLFPIWLSSPSSSNILTYLHVFYSGFLNDLWKLSWKEPEPEPEPITEPPAELVPCPPFHQLINNTCIPFLQCKSDVEDNNSSNCVLECAETGESGCTIEGDVIINNPNVDSNTVTIVGTVNVSGDVRVTDNMKLKLPPGATLHVGKCLVLDEGSGIVAVVEGRENEGSVLATYDASCSSQQLAEQVIIERTSSFDECQDGKPNILQYPGIRWIKWKSSAIIVVCSNGYE